MPLDNDSEDLLQALKQRIRTHLSLCDESETPVICGMLGDEQSENMLIDLVVKKVVNEKYDVPSAIIAINNEFDPNSLD